ncbi:MAG: carbon-nitrogen hydrolase family protein, partial [Candidatus Hydrogenedentota bacterium]
MKKRKGLITLLITAILIISVVSFLEISEKKGSIFRRFLYNEKEADKRLKVATIAMQCDVDPEVNRRKMVGMIHHVKDAHPDVELIVFGETILGWYKKVPETRQYHEEIAEPIPGITTRLMSKSALENKIHISFGMVERDDGKLYNSQVLIDPE